MFELVVTDDTRSGVTTTTTTTTHLYRECYNPLHNQPSNPSYKTDI